MLHVMLHQNCSRAPLALMQAGCRSLLQSQHAYASASSASQADPQAAETPSNNSSTASSIEVTMHGATAVLELNRPKQMNALSTQVISYHIIHATVPGLPYCASCSGTAVGSGSCSRCGGGATQPALVKASTCLKAYFADTLGAAQTSMWVPHSRAGTVMLQH